MGKKYNIIYIDPPWKYKDKAHAGKRGVDYKYHTMKDKDILELPIEQLAAKDCIMFMWATFPRLELALEAMKAWGFKYKTLGFVWCKKNKLADSWFWGMGSWTRANAEICIIGVRGKPRRQSAKIHQIITARISKHSAKPDEVREKIVELCGKLPRIEIFAREKMPGWDAIGNDVDGLDIRDSLKLLVCHQQ